MYIYNSNMHKNAMDLKLSYYRIEYFVHQIFASVIFLQTY